MNLRRISVLAALTAAAGCLYAQESSTEEAQLEALEKRTSLLEKAVRKLNNFKVSAYIQAQYQYGEKDATLKVGDSNENRENSFNRFGIRRGRIKFEYREGIGEAAVQLEVNDKGVSFRDLYIGVKDPWTGRNQLLAGIFNRPFGYEIGYSTSSLESPERATVIQYFFPDERDLGAMLTLQAPEKSPLDFLKLEAGIFAGNSINMDTDNKKDFIGHLSASRPLGRNARWGLGASYYRGFVYNPAATEYRMENHRFVPVEKGKTGTFAKREYFGFDGQFSLNTAWGRSTVRGEVLWGWQPGTAGSSKSPNYSRRPEDAPENALYKRPFTGYFFYFVHDIGRSPFSVVAKYDAYDPNTRVKGDEAGRADSRTSKTDLAQHTVGMGGLWRINKNLRLQAYYEINRNEKSACVPGYESDREDNVLTVRLQYKF